MENREWIRCPICDSKTRDRIRKDTDLTNYKLKSSESQTLRRRADEFVGNYPQFIGFSFLEQENQ